MKAVLISIQPKWCELIAAGKKTVEVRKTKPNLDVPFTCYIYQTRMKWLYKLLDSMGLYKLEYRLRMAFGKVAGEFVCNKMSFIEADIDLDGDRHLYNTVFLQHRMCLTDDELFQYLYRGKDKNNGGWGWHISKLRIYDRPKRLAEFELFRAPQSWCYVEELE